MDSVAEEFLLSYIFRIILKPHAEWLSPLEILWIWISQVTISSLSDG
jgi:hypothetical protein